MEARIIRGGLVANGHNYASIGRGLDPPVSRQAVRMVANHETTSKRIMLALAKALGKKPAEVFPEAAHLFKNNSNIAKSEAA